MRTAILLFTRDLRVHDHPALRAAAAGADRIVPLFVLDDALLAGFGAPNRVKFLFECLHDLRDSLANRGAPLVVRRGDTIREVRRIADETSAETVCLSDDVSSFAQRGVAALRGARLEVKACPGITVVQPGALEPTGGGDAFKVFTPYWRRWQHEPLREVLGAPRTLKAPSKLTSGRIPAAPAHTSPAVAEGGEAAARKRANTWIRDHLHDYEAGSDDLAGDRTSRLSPLHPLRLHLAARAGRAGRPRGQSIRASALLA